MSADKNHKEKEIKRAREKNPEESLQKLIEDSKTKSEAYKKILKSLNINKNRD
jgi:hypothetical protein